MTKKVENTPPWDEEYPEYIRHYNKPMFSFQVYKKKKRFHTASAQTRAKFRKKIKLKKARCRKMSRFLLFTYFGSAYVNSLMVICYVSMVALYRFMPELFCCVIDI